MFFENNLIPLLGVAGFTDKSSSNGDPVITNVSFTVTDPVPDADKNKSSFDNEVDISFFCIFKSASSNLLEYTFPISVLSTLNSIVLSIPVVDSSNAVNVVSLSAIPGCNVFEKAYVT